MLLVHGPRTGGMMPDGGRAVLLALRFSRRLLVLMTNLTKSVLPFSRIGRVVRKGARHACSQGPAPPSPAGCCGASYCLTI